MIIITITAEPGDNISQTIGDSVEVAKKLNRDVEMVFNDTRVRVHPDSSAIDIMEKWMFGRMPERSR